MGFGLATSGDKQALPKQALPTWNLRSERPHVICGELMGVVSDSGAGWGRGRRDWFDGTSGDNPCAWGPGQGGPWRCSRTRPAPRDLPRLRRQPPANVGNTHSSELRGGRRVSGWGGGRARRGAVRSVVIGRTAVVGEHAPRPKGGRRPRDRAGRLTA